MQPAARLLSPARRSYRGTITDPARWSGWAPRRGDILVTTPPKCGTTWTQTILAMLVHGGPDLPAPVPVLSPWLDADFGVPMPDIAAALDAQTGRRVIKTHTPADGLPLWDGVNVVAVYRHPLDVFLSLRNHSANTAAPEPDDPFLLPFDAAFDAYLDGDASRDDLDRDTLAKLAMHYCETALSGAVPGLSLFHYADMLRDPRRAVADMAAAIGVPIRAALIDTVTRATGFAAMKERAADFAPVGGTGYWKSDDGFFAAAASGTWAGKLSPSQVERYRKRLAVLVPDTAARQWLETGGPRSA